jgi:hypothetical protein
VGKNDMKTFNHTWVLMIAIASSLWVPFTVPDVWRENAIHGWTVAICGSFPFAWVVGLWVFRQRVSVYVTVQGMLVAIFISWVCINVSAYIHHCTSLVLPWNAFISFPLSVIMLWRMNRIKQRLKPQPTDARSRGTGLSSFKSCDEA